MRKPHSSGTMMALAEHDRPREKLERLGPGALGDNELVAVLIGHGTAGSGALEVANRVLAGTGGVHGLVRMTSDELAEFDGVGLTLAARIQAALELGRRTLCRPPAARPQLLNAREMAALLVPEYGAHPVERFGVALLDVRHRLIRTQLLTVGVLDASVVHPRDVFRVATLAGASAIVAFHNHPSGDVTPSADDVALTTRLFRAGDVMGIDLLDHLILADTQYCSLREAGHSAWRG
jgi:DNA repair protein RadC